MADYYIIYIHEYLYIQYIQFSIIYIRIYASNGYYNHYVNVHVNIFSNQLSQMRFAKRHLYIHYRTHTHDSCGVCLICISHGMCTRTL